MKETIKKKKYIYLTICIIIFISIIFYVISRNGLKKEKKGKSDEIPVESAGSNEYINEKPNVSNPDTDGRVMDMENSVIYNVIDEVSETESSAEENSEFDQKGSVSFLNESESTVKERKLDLKETESMKKERGSTNTDKIEFETNETEVVERDSIKSDKNKTEIVNSTGIGLSIEDNKSNITFAELGHAGVFFEILRFLNETNPVASFDDESSIEEESIQENINEETFFNENESESDEGRKSVCTNNNRLDSELVNEAEELSTNRNILSFSWDNIKFYSILSFGLLYLILVFYHNFIANL